MKFPFKNRKVGLKAPRRTRLETQKEALRLRMELKTSRLKRHSGSIAKEIGTSALLVVLVMIVTFSMILGCDRLVHSSLFSIRETVVRGCSEITEKEVLSLARIRSGATLLTVNVEAIVQRIRGNAWVRDVFVGREFPDRLVIWVRERNAVALIEKENLLYLVDSNGEVFKKLETEEKADFPVLTGFFSGNHLDSGLLGKSLVLLNHLQAAKLTPAIGAVSEINGNETFGFSVFTDKGLCLQFGFEGYETKLKNLSPVLADMERKNLKTGLVLIDLSDPEKINVQSRTALLPERTDIKTPKGKKLRL